MDLNTMTYGAVNGTDFSMLQGSNTYQADGQPGTGYMPQDLDYFRQQMLPQQHQEALTGNQHNQQYYGHSLAHHRPVMHEPVITREENYPAAAAILTQIENKLAALQAEVDATKQAAEAAIVEGGTRWGEKGIKIIYSKM
ncbi:hypothetical protein B0H11DRAFT_2217516 [Mycena galericulata]|nr:hypothetical protein B0H11DRAFT_2217516 [Mycena galericulata]